MNVKEEEDGAGGGREQDRFLPIANISRIMKKALPPNAKIAKDAKETVQECVSEFISFITSEASDKCQREKRKTINGDDLLWAMATLGFDEYVEPLKLYLAKFREAEQAALKPGGDVKKEKNTATHSPPHLQQQQQQMAPPMMMPGFQPGMMGPGGMMTPQMLAGMAPNFQMLGYGQGLPLPLPLPR